ncbi:MAG TPA: biopolymer transporter ExbD [Candidatus Binatia bacterium]|nr:biopolymer transporter ExbD [Candidatus Binatia bacterium]
MASPRKKKGSGSAIMAEINITPLTDIFLVLLIIFMVTSVAMVQSGANINLPQVQDTQSEPRQIVVTVTPQKEIFVNNTPTTLPELRVVLCPMVDAQKDVPVILEGDKDVILGEAVKILSIAQVCGATQIAIAAERS